MAVAELPLTVAPRLSPIERQWQELMWLRGWGAVLGVAAGGLAAVLIADTVFNLPSVIRAAGLGLIGLLTVVAIGFRLVRPWWRGMTLADAADWIERAHPELQERLRTCLDLEQTISSGPASRAATLMRRQVRKETVSLLESVETDDALPPERAFRAFGLGLLALAVLIAPFGVWTTGYGLSWQRTFNPWGNHGWGRSWLVAGDPGDQVHPRGRDLTVFATGVHRRHADRVPEQLTLHWRPLGTSEWDERRLLPDETTPKFAAVIPRLSADTEWYVTGPASASPRYRVTVVDPPEITQFTADVDPLPYTGQPSQHADVLSELSAPIGSVLRLQVAFDRPVTAVELQWPALGAAPGARGAASTAVSTVNGILSSDQRTATIRVRAERSGPFHLIYHGEQGLTVNDEPRRLVVVPDEPPHVAFIGGASVTVRPDDRFDLSISARDDFGLGKAEWQLTVSDKDVRTTSLPITPRTPDGWTWKPTVDVAALGLNNGQAVTLRARVADNREWPSPQEVWSTPQVIVISQSAPSAAERALMQQTNDARHDLQELLRELAAHREQLRDVHQKTAAATVKQRDAEQDARLAELETKQQDLTEQLKNWMTDLPESGPWQPIRAAAQDALDDELAKANTELQQGREADPREQIEHLSRALDDLAAAQRELQRLDDAIRALGNLGPELGELAQLANEADRLAEKLDGQPQAMPEQREQAEQLQRDLERVIEDRPELQAAIQQAQRDRAAANARQAEQLAKQQRQLADAIQAQSPEQGDAESRPADANQPTNGPMPPASAEFTAGKSATERLQQTADQAVQVAESLLNELGPDAPPVEKAVQAARDLAAASQAAEQGQLAQAQEQAKQAQASLEEAAKDFPPAASHTPVAKETQQLADQTKDLNQQLEPIANSPDAQRGSQAATQQQLAEATQSISQPQAQGQPPTPGQQSLAAAQQAMQETQAALQAGDSQQAAKDAQEAAQALEQAAQQLPSQTKDNKPTDLTVPSAAGEALSAAEQNLQAAQQRLQEAAKPSDPMPSTEQPQQGQPQQQPMVQRPAEQQPSSESQSGQPSGQQSGQQQSGQQQSVQQSGQQSAQQSGQQSGQQSQSQQEQGQGQQGPGQQGQPGQEGQRQRPGSQPGGQPSSQSPPGQSAQPGTLSTSMAANDLRQAGNALRHAVDQLTGQPKAPSHVAKPQTGTFQAPSGQAQESDRPAESILSGGPASLEKLEQKLQAATQRNWGRLPGKLQTEILEGGQLPSHPEYARQIQKYFQTIAQPVSDDMP